MEFNLDSLRSAQYLNNHSEHIEGLTMRLLFICIMLLSGYLYADTINNYMNIANNIPQMEIKADPQAQAWARSARHVLAITSESIAETLIQSNEIAKNQGKPIFCLPQGKELNSIMMNELIQQTYKEISSQQSDKDKMTVSQVAFLAVTKHFPCPSSAHLISEMKHVGGYTP